VFKSGDLSRTSVKVRKRAVFCRRRAVEDQCDTIFRKSIAAPNREVAMEPKRRRLEWAERPNFQGWACSECAWVFNPSWPLAGKSVNDMKTEFGQHRDKEFASHVCAEHPRATKNPG
jgi:rubredoxin